MSIECYYFRKPDRDLLYSFSLAHKVAFPGTNKHQSYSLTFDIKSVMWYTANNSLYKSESVIYFFYIFFLLKKEKSAGHASCTKNQL